MSTLLSNMGEETVLVKQEIEIKEEDTETPFEDIYAAEIQNAKIKEENFFQEFPLKTEKEIETQEKMKLINIMENLTKESSDRNSRSNSSRSFNKSEPLRLLLLPVGDHSESESEDSEVDEILAPPNTLDVDDNKDENDAIINELVCSSRLQLECEFESDGENISVSNLFPSNVNRPQMKNNIQWHKNQFNQPEDISWKDSSSMDKSWGTFTPLEFFNLIFDDSTFQHITDQTNIYCLQSKGLELGRLKKNEIMAFVGILLKLGLVKPPSYKYFWKNTSRYPCIADSLTRDKFEKIKSFLHFNDNRNILPIEHPEYDKLFRIRPIIESIRSNLLQIPQEEHQAVDEQIIPTKAHISLKQYMPQKNHKWGYKVICRAGESGFIYDFLLYTGKDSIEDDESVGLASAHLLKLTENVPRNRNYKIYFDNWFSSLRLVDVLNSQGILFLSTVKANRLKGLKLKDGKELQREGRGSLDYSVERNRQSIAIKWYDNKPVHLLSNYAGVEPVDTCSRWDANQRRRVDVSRPFAVREYNKYIGGVALSNALIELYRINFKSKKWYMRIFFYLLDMSVVNSWLLYRRVQSQKQNGKTLSLLDFREDIASGLMNSTFTPKTEGPSAEPIVKKRRMGCRPSDSSRLDQLTHWPDWSQKPQRCRRCIEAHSKVRCLKCGVNLCFTKYRNCFYEFHKK